MPQWVSRTFVHPSAVPPPPPGPPAGPARDNDYEEIGPPARRQAAEHAMNTASRQQQQQNRTGSGNAKDRAHCDLCGGSASAVRCDRCSGQVFCLSCDDMYHRHPKRSAHVRKAVDSIQRPFRPPLPPKSDLQPPVPPPRRNKRFGLFGKKEQSPALPRKESASGVMGSLKRFMGVRPLPPPPTQKGGLTSVWEEPSVQPLPPNLGPPQATVQRSPSRGSVDSGRPPSDDTSAALPATVAAINDAERHQRPAAQDQRDADRDPVPVRPRSQSVSAHMSPAAQQHQQHQQAWMYPPEHQHPHQHDMLQGFVTTRRGQSYRAGWPGMVAAGGSVCDMTSPPAGHHIGHPLAHPGFHPHMMHAQSLAQLGCPTCHGHGPPLWYPAEPADDQLHRYPSNSSLTAAAAPVRFVSQRDLRQPSPAPSARSGRAARPRRLARSQMELSRYPTDSDEPGSGVESDDESDAPADEVAAWACPHCTFQNSAGTRVCAMCCRSAPAAVAQQRAAHRRRRRRRFPRGPMPPGSPAPLRARDPSPGSVSHGRERSQRSVSRGPSLGRDAAPAELADGVQAMKLEAASRERRPSDAAAAAAAAVPRRVSVASESAAEGPAQTTASVGTSDAEGGALPSESTQRDGATSVARKRTQSTGTSPPPQTIATQVRSSVWPPAVHRGPSIKQTPTGAISAPLHSARVSDRLWIRLKKCRLYLFTPDEAAMYSEGSLGRAGSRTSLAGDYEPFRYGHREARSLKRTQSFQAFGQRERQERADPWLYFGTLGSRFQGRSGSKSSVHSAASDSRAFAAYGSGASSRGESPARYGGERSHSRHRSYAGETARKPADGSDYLVGLEEVMLNRKSDASASQGMELVLMLRDAEQHNFSPEDLQIALNHCSERPPVAWLLDNLDSMIETVCTLATNYGHERPENDVGTISNKEARDALRLHKGNVWSAVTECVEQRRKKYAQLASRGAFPREDVITALTANHGSVEAAYLDLNRTQLKPFLMRLWGPPQGVEVNEGAPPGRPEVTPPPATEPEVNVAVKPDTAEVRAAAAQADGGTPTEKAAVPPDGEVKVTPPGSAEVKVTPKVGSATVLASAKADIADSGSRSDQCSTLSSDIDTDDDDACKSKDYITPPTSPLFRRANRGIQPAPEPALAAPPPRSSASPAQSVPAAGPRPAELPQPPVQPPVPSSAPDPSPSSGIYETVATPAAATQHKTPHTREDRPYDKPTEKKTGTSETETKNAQLAAQPAPSQPTERHVAPPTSPLSGCPAGRSAPPTPPAEPVWAAPAGPPAAAAASDRDSSEDYEPAVYGELLVARAAGSPRPVQGADGAGAEGRRLDGESPAPADRRAVAGSGTAPARETGRSAAVSETAPARETSRLAAQSTVAGSEDVAPAPGADTDTQERRSSDSSSSSSASTDVTEREQLVRPEPAGWVRSEIYSSPAQGAPRAAPESTDAPRAATDSTDALRATPESTAVSETPGLSPSLSPTPGPLLAASRHNLSPSERLELAKRVICNHVQRQRPAAVPGAAAGSSSPSEPPTEPAGAPQGPSVHYGPSEPYTPASAAEIPAIEDGADCAGSGEEAGSGGHVVFTSSDSLSEGYEPVVSARFQPGVGRGGGVRSSTRSPMPSAALAASSSAESLSRSDHQAAPRSVQQTAPASGRQMTPRSTATGQEGLGVAGRAEPTAETERQEPPGAEAASEPRTDAELADSRAAESDSAVGESTAVKQNTEEAARAETDPPAAPNEAPSPTLRGADETAGQTSTVGRASESSDSDSDSDSAAAGAAGPSDVDLAALREGLKSGRSSVLRRNSAERQKVQRCASRLVRSGRARSQADAELAAQLMALRFPAEDSLQAASECSSLYAAVSFLHQECELCAGRCSASELVGMTHCTHRCCRSCAQAYFTQRIKERPLADLRCPFCNEPDLTSEEIASDYFSHLDIMLKTLVSPEVHALFHKKLFERAMMKDPNFKWCPKCSSGFIAAPRQQKLHCPDCGAVSCALCAKTWSAQHEGVSCERFAMWQQQNDPDYQSAGLERHLAESGISCPSCRFRYSLAKGGCMHFTCSQCKYEFCSGCSQPFSMGSRCGKTELCSRLGLHAHHPRNCLFYLRDKEPRQLQQLLKSNGVAYDTAPPSGSGVYGDAPRRCRVPEQKETASGLRDDLCGRTVFPDNAGLCRMHYIEYLCGLVWKHQLDPVAISDAADLRQEMRRHGKRVRIQRVRESDEKYTAALRKIVEAELPLNV
ncbi:serine/arginine repetitive matrix protein 2-like [Amphibalanus amphitrite]|uniref:serine/arginine repetitive matrix protein 2-like n=1 Tax=Amphibalanus amphitrite TaxID=1232801 RepID=UPI001C8FD462|nr:serine/arginine repetitive matrix protein 2-like [Amphibalanus amphitrite]